MLAVAGVIIVNMTLAMSVNAKIPRAPITKGRKDVKPEKRQRTLAASLKITSSLIDRKRKIPIMPLPKPHALVATTKSAMMIKIRQNVAGIAMSVVDGTIMANTLPAQNASVKTYLVTTTKAEWGAGKEKSPCYSTAGLTMNPPIRMMIIPFGPVILQIMPYAMMMKTQYCVVMIKGNVADGIMLANMLPAKSVSAMILPVNIMEESEGVRLEKTLDCLSAKIMRTKLTRSKFIKTTMFRSVIFV